MHGHLCTVARRASTNLSSTNIRKSSGIACVAPTSAPQWRCLLQTVFPYKESDYYINTHTIFRNQATMVERLTSSFRVFILMGIISERSASRLRHRSSPLFAHLNHTNKSLLCRSATIEPGENNSIINRMHTAIIAVNIQEGTELQYHPLLNFLLINKLQYLWPGLFSAKYRVAESRQIINTLSL